MFNRIKDTVVVITGASSGIGRATALDLAQKGVHVVAAARREEALNSLVRECESLGTPALAVPTDVTDEDAVQRLAARATEQFGGIDTWINNAGVNLFARFEEAPSDAFRKVIETNLFGYIHGARAAIQRFRKQGHGTLINISSMLARGGSPYISAYVTSKYGINGLTKSLRQELRDTNIDVCLVMPASVDTPMYQQAANYTGRAVKPMEPIYDPSKVSKAIIKMIKKPTDEVYVGNVGRMMGTLNKVSHRSYEKAMARQVERDHFRELPSPERDGNLFEPQEHWGRTDGGWNGKQGMLNGAGKVVVAGLMLTIPAAAMMLWSSKSKSTRVDSKTLRRMLPR